MNIIIIEDPELLADFYRLEHRDGCRGCETGCAHCETDEDEYVADVLAAIEGRYLGRRLPTVAECEAARAELKARAEA